MMSRETKKKKKKTIKTLVLLRNLDDQKVSAKLLPLDEFFVRAPSSSQWRNVTRLGPKRYALKAVETPSGPCAVLEFKGGQLARNVQMVPESQAKGLARQILLLNKRSGREVAEGLAVSTVAVPSWAPLAAAGAAVVGLGAFAAHKYGRRPSSSSASKEEKKGEEVQKGTKEKEGQEEKEETKEKEEQEEQEEQEEEEPEEVEEIPEDPEKKEELEEPEKKPDVPRPETPSFLVVGWENDWHCLGLQKKENWTKHKKLLPQWPELAVPGDQNVLYFILNEYVVKTAAIEDDCQKIRENPSTWLASSEYVLWQNKAVSIEKGRVHFEKETPDISGLANAALVLRYPRAIAVDGDSKRVWATGPATEPLVDLPEQVKGPITALVHQNVLIVAGQQDRMWALEPGHKSHNWVVLDHSFPQSNDKLRRFYVAVGDFFVMAKLLESPSTNELVLQISYSTFASKTRLNSQVFATKPLVLHGSLVPNLAPPQFLGVLRNPSSFSPSSPSLTPSIPLPVKKEQEYVLVALPAWPPNRPLELYEYDPKTWQWRERRDVVGPVPVATNVRGLASLQSGKLQFLTGLQDDPKDEDVLEKAFFRDDPRERERKEEEDPSPVQIAFKGYEYELGYRNGSYKARKILDDKGRRGGWVTYPPIPFSSLATFAPGLAVVGPNLYVLGGSMDRRLGSNLPTWVESLDMSILSQEPIKKGLILEKKTVRLPSTGFSRLVVVRAKRIPDGILFVTNSQGDYACLNLDHETAWTKKLADPDLQELKDWSDPESHLEAVDDVLVFIDTSKKPHLFKVSRDCIVTTTNGATSSKGPIFLLGSPSSKNKNLYIVTSNSQGPSGLFTPKKVPALTVVPLPDLAKNQALALFGNDLILLGGTDEAEKPLTQVKTISLSSSSSSSSSSLRLPDLPVPMGSPYAFVRAQDDEAVLFALTLSKDQNQKEIYSLDLTSSEKNKSKKWHKAGTLPLPLAELKNFTLAGNHLVGFEFKAGEKEIVPWVADFSFSNLENLENWRAFPALQDFPLAFEDSTRVVGLTV